MNQVEFVRKGTQLSEKSIKNVIHLIEDGATIPFISRYRKEMTGGLDEVDIAVIRDGAKMFSEIVQRQKSIVKAIDDQGKLTEDLKIQFLNCFDLTSLEDIYLPFKQKKVTRGEKARKAGLESLAKMIMSQRDDDPFKLASRFVKNDVKNELDAISGAKDIIAEWINENIN